MTSSLRLAFCDRPPYSVPATATEEPSGAWLSVTADIVRRRGWDVQFLPAPASACLEGPQEALLALLTRGAADVAVYPYIFNATADIARTARLTEDGTSLTTNLVSLYPIENNSPIFVSERDPPQGVRLFTDPFTGGAWALLGALLAISVLAAVTIDYPGHHWERAARTTFAAFGSVEVSRDTRAGVRVLYCWLAAMSILLVGLYTSIMAQILLLSEAEVDSYASAAQRGAAVAVTRDISDQLKFSRSPFNQVLSSNFTTVDERDALASLPVLTSWPVSKMMRQMSCENLDVSYREISRISYSMIALNATLPPWLYRDVRDAVFDRSYPNAVQRFVDTPDCATVEVRRYPQLQLIGPALYVGAAFIGMAWVAGAVRFARDRRGTQDTEITSSQP